MKILINVGSQTPNAPDESLALGHIIAFRDALLDRRVFLDIVPHKEMNGSFRCGYLLYDGNFCVRVAMPGAEKVRYQKGDNPFDFPRLYIDGDSYLWCDALNQVEKKYREYVEWINR